VRRLRLTRAPRRRGARRTVTPPRIAAGRRLGVRLLRDGNANSHPSCRPRGFSPPRRFSPPRPCDHFQAAADRGVHGVSSCRETGIPTVHLLPFEAFPPPTATVAGTNPGPPWARVTAPIVADRHVHREPCPLVLPLAQGTSRPCSIVGSVANANVAVRARPVLPWACPAAPSSRHPRPAPRGGCPLRERSVRSGRTVPTNRPAVRQRPLRRATPSV
jgi:hypothetical protein